MSPPPDASPRLYQPNGQERAERRPFPAAWHSAPLTPLDIPPAPSSTGDAAP